MIPSLKGRRLAIKDHLNIILCRHIATVIILTLAFGAFAFYTQRNIPLTIIAGFALSVILSYLAESLDSTLKTPEDVEHCAKMVFLGYIPSIEKELDNRRDADIISHRRHYSYAAEAFRKVKAVLLDTSSQESPIKTLIVSSFIPKEGKSFVATNLAIVFAAAGEPTLLIDGDMRRGRLNEIFNTGSDRGLSNALAGISSWQEGVVSTTIPNLSLLPLGVPAPNPAELLLKVERWKDILREAETRFKRVIIDSPPVLNVADAIILGSKCDGLIFVIKAGVTPLKHIIDAQKIIGGRVKVLGAVLNGVDVKRSRH